VFYNPENIYKQNEFVQGKVNNSEENIQFTYSLTIVHFKRLLNYTIWKELQTTCTIKKVYEEIRVQKEISQAFFSYPQSFYIYLNWSINFIPFTNIFTNFNSILNHT